MSSTGMNAQNTFNNNGKRLRDSEEFESTIPKNLGNGPKWDLPQDLSKRTETCDAITATRNSSKTVAEWCLEEEDDSGIVKIYSRRTGERVGRLFKKILQTSSDVFKTMLEEGNFLETMDSKGMHVYLDGSENALKFLLAFFIQGRPRKHYDDVDARELWILADMYQIKFMREFLMDQVIKPETLLPALNFSYSSDVFEYAPDYAKKIRNYCIDLGLGNFYIFLQTIYEKDLKGIHVDAIRFIIEKQIKSLNYPSPTYGENSYKLFKFVRRWVLENNISEEECDETIRDIMNMLPFRSILPEIKENDEEKEFLMKYTFSVFIVGSHNTMIKISGLHPKCSTEYLWEKIMDENKKNGYEYCPTIPQLFFNTKDICYRWATDKIRDQFCHLGHHGVKEADIIHAEYFWFGYSQLIKTDD